MSLQLELFPALRTPNPALNPCEFTDISPIPCWLQTTKTGWTKGKAVARNGHNYYRVLWGKGQQSNVPEKSLRWKEPKCRAECLSQ